MGVLREKETRESMERKLQEEQKLRGKSLLASTHSRQWRMQYSCYVVLL